VFPVMKPSLPSFRDLGPRFSQIEDAGQYSNYGPQVVELQERFANRFGISPDRVVVLANATLAIAGLTQILDPERWLVPSWTFVATALSVLQTGKDLVFGDVGIDTHRLRDVSSAEGRSSIVTLPFGAGIPSDWTTASDFPAVIDAAASLGSVDSLVGLPPHANIVFSLHATKYLGSGEGGLVVSGTAQTAAELRAWSNFGFDSDRRAVVRGTNAKMSEFQAAIAHCALDEEALQRSQWLELRKRSQAIDRELGVDIPQLSANSIAPYWIVDFGSQKARDRAEKVLLDSSIETRRWWQNGCHEMPALAGLAWEGNLENSKSLARTTLGLPYFRGMLPGDFQRIGDLLS